MEKQIRKVEMYAKNIYQYNKLQNASFYFVPCEMAEDKEVIKFTYDLEGLTSLDNIDRGNKDLIYSLLIQICQMTEIRKEFSFSLEPQNLYFDAHGRIMILQRDLQEPGEWSEENFLEEIKALSGHLLQKKYTYKDILQGGKDLLERNDITRGILKWQSLEEALEALEKRQEKLRQNEKNTICRVNRKKYITLKIALVVMIVLALVCGGLFLYQRYNTLSLNSAALDAERAYLDLNYVQTIDSLAKVDLENMNAHEKYILAVSYIKGQEVDTFSEDAKEMILSKLTVNGSVAYMEYWIHLGRLETAEAQDIAMQLSDDQLLLYAYIQELDNVSGDLQMEGNEKAEKKADLEGKITGLADKLGIVYKQEKK